MVVNEDDEKIIILHKKDWHEGVIGIIAGRIKEQNYYKIEHQNVRFSSEIEDYRDFGEDFDTIEDDQWIRTLL